MNKLSHKKQEKDGKTSKVMEEKEQEKNINEDVVAFLEIEQRNELNRKNYQEKKEILRKQKPWEKKRKINRMRR